MNPQDYLLLFVGILLGGVLGYIFAKLGFARMIKDERKHAVKTSKAVVMGQVSEKVAPLLPNFPYSYKDMTFVGKGIDYIVFDGLYDGDVSQVVFLEIKSGRSQLNKNEKRIRDAIEGGRISYEIVRLA